MRITSDNIGLILSISDHTGWIPVAKGRAEVEIIEPSAQEIDLLIAILSGKDARYIETKVFAVCAQVRNTDGEARRLSFEEAGRLFANSSEEEQNDIVNRTWKIVGLMSSEEELEKGLEKARAEAGEKKS